MQSVSANILIIYIVKSLCLLMVLKSLIVIDCLKQNRSFKSVIYMDLKLLFFMPFHALAIGIFPGFAVSCQLNLTK